MFARRKRLEISLALAVLLALPPVTLAQKAPAAINDWAGLKTVTAGSKLDVKLKNGKTVKGNLISVSDTALSLSDDNKPTDLNQADIQSVYLIRGQSVMKSTLIGAAIVGGAGVALGAAGGNSDSGGWGPGYNAPAVAAALGVIGAGVGAAGGAVIGKIRRKRTIIYQAKQP
jgi:small nuclear ribonucleoprotein (snRNP)-like protein